MLCMYPVNDSQSFITEVDICCISIASTCPPCFGALRTSWSQFITLKDMYKSPKFNATKCIILAYLDLSSLARSTSSAWPTCIYHFQSKVQSHQRLNFFALLDWQGLY